MYSRKDIERYIDFVKNGEGYEEDYLHLKEECKKRKYFYHGKPLPFAYQPLLVSDKDDETFNYITKMTYSIVSKVTNRYVNDEDYRKLFNYSKFEEKMILHVPLCKTDVPMARFDIFYESEDNFKFCEINTDGSSAMIEDLNISTLLMESKIFNDLAWNFRSYELFDSWVNYFIENYYKDTEKELKTVLIADFNEAGTQNEFVEFQKHFEKMGIKCIIEDIRELKYNKNENALYSNGVQIDAVYRRVVMSDLREHLEDSSDFVDAYLNDAAYFVGPFRSQVVHNKVFFAILHMDETKEFLTDEENDFINKHIPYTIRFEGDEEFFNNIVKHKDKYIFKPCNLNASRGVYLGREYSTEEFIIKAREDFNKDYIVQEFVERKTIPFLKLINGKWSIIDLGNMIGLFSYFGKFSGIYARMGEDDIIKTTGGYITAPAIRY